MSPLCIRGSTRTVSTLWDIPRSSPNLVIQTFLLILAWQNARCFHPVVSSILCYLTITLANSPFHSVFPAWPRKCPNLHTDLQCQLVVTWCIPDLLKAIEKGYTVVCVHEVWHFLTTRKGLFKDYMNTWLKIKEEASRWPSHLGDNPLKCQRHLDNYRDRGDRIGPGKDREKSRTAYAGQDEVKLHVG